VRSDVEASKQTVTESAPTNTGRKHRGYPIFSPPQRETGEVEADLPDSEDEDEDTVAYDRVVPGVPWDDSHFLLPSYIVLGDAEHREYKTGIEWIRPQVIA